MRRKNKVLVILAFVVIWGTMTVEANTNAKGVALPDRPNLFCLPKGTPIIVHVTQPISSDTAKIGDTVDFEVSQDVTIDGIVVIPKGSKARGFIADAMSGQMWGSAQLGIHVGMVYTRTGLAVPTSGTVNASSVPNSNTANTTQTASEARQQPVKEVTVSPDTPIVAFTELDIPVDRTLYGQPDAADSVLGRLN